MNNENLYENTNKVDRIGGIFDKDDKIHQAGSIYNKECLSPTITTCEGGYRQPIVKDTKINKLDEKEFKIRKLTSLECWRLMGFNNEDFYNAQKLGISDSQLYKQAGNSIVVNVLEAIFKNLFIHKIK